MVKYFGIIDETAYKGYSNTVKSLLEDVKDKEIIDLSLENAEEKVLEAGKDEYTDYLREIATETVGSDKKINV